MTTETPTKVERRGGPRKGAGRPVETRTIKRGQEFVGMAAGEPPQVWTVAEVTRTVIVLTKADGETVRLLNG